MKKVKKILRLIMLLVCVAGVAKAEELSVNLDTMDEKGQFYTLRIYNKGVDIETASDTDIVAFDDGETLSDGKISFVLDFGYPSGIYKYVVKSFSNDFEEYGEVSFTNEKEYKQSIADLLATLHETNVGASARKVFEEHRDVFLIYDSFDIYDDVTILADDNTYERIVRRITNDITLDELKKIYRQEMMLNAMKSAELRLIVKMNCEYGDELGLSNDKVNDYYNKLSETAKLNAAEKEKGSYGSAEEYFLAHSQAVAIESINNVSSWNGMKQIINDLNDIAELEFPKGLGEAKEAIILNRLSDKIPFSSVLDFKEEVGRLEKKQEHGGSGNGGSTNSNKNTSGGKTSYIIPSIDKKQDADPVPQKTFFDDISEVKWAEDAINNLASKKIISGRKDRKFVPNDYIKREEFVKIIVDAFNIGNAEVAAFDDVSGDEWFAPYINRAVASGITKGFGDGKFGVGINITREDACVIIARAVGMDSECDIELSFSDCEDISDYSINAIKNLVKAGAVRGADGKIMPKNNITRAETAVIVSALLEVIEE